MTWLFLTRWSNKCFYITTNCLIFRRKVRLNPIHSEQNKNQCCISAMFVAHALHCITTESEKRALKLCSATLSDTVRQKHYTITCSSSIQFWDTFVDFSRQRPSLINNHFLMHQRWSLTRELTIVGLCRVSHHIGRYDFALRYGTQTYNFLVSSLVKHLIHVVTLKCDVLKKLL